MAPSVVPVTTGLLLNASAAEHARQALAVLTGSQHAAGFEPLAVGLRIYLGESPRVARKTLDIGKDVAEKPPFRECCNRLIGNSAATMVPSSTRNYISPPPSPPSPWEGNGTATTLTTK